MRINRAIELLAEDQAVYYTGEHAGHVLRLHSPSRQFSHRGIEKRSPVGGFVRACVGGSTGRREMMNRLVRCAEPGFARGLAWLGR